MKKNATGRLMLLATALIWGSSFFVMKQAVDSIPVFFVLAIRFTIGAIVISLPLLPRLRRIPPSVWGHGLLCGALEFSAYVTQSYGLMGTTPGKNAFLTAVYCVLVPFVCWLCWREQPSKWNWIAAVLCVIGIGLVSLTGDLSISWGDGLTLVSGVLYAFQVALLGHYAHQGDHPIALTVSQFAMAAGLSWICSVIWAPGAHIPQSAWPQMIYLSVIVTGLAMLLQAVGQTITPAPQAAILMSLESVFGILFSVLFYGERVNARMLTGFTVIFLSVLISETHLSFLHLPGLHHRSKR